MHRVQTVRALRDHRLFVEFTDGVKGEIDLSGRLFGPVFEPLEDLELFRQVSVDAYGAVCWPNGADLAPDALYKTLTETLAGSSG